MTAEYIIRLRDMFTSPLSRMEGKMNRFESQLQHTQGSVNSFGNSLTSAFAGGAIVAGASMLASKLKDIAVSSFDAAMEFNNMKSAITFSSGGNGTGNIKYLDNLINRLGLVKESAYSSFKTFEGGIMGTKLEGKKGLEIFEAMSEAGTVLKLSNDQMGGSFLALSQMASKGIVSAEELRGQLGERLPGAFNIAARAMGVTTGKLGEMLKSGEIMSEDFLPKFAAELKKTFGPAVQSAQTEFNANWNRLKNYAYDAQVAFGNHLLPVLNDLALLIPKINFKPITDGFTQIGSQIGTLTSEFNGLLKLVGVSVSTFDAISFAVGYFGGVLRAIWTPIRYTLQAWTQFITVVKSGIPIFEGLGMAMGGLLTRNFKRFDQGIERMRSGILHFGDDSKRVFKEFAEQESAGWSSLFSRKNPAFGNVPQGGSRASFLTGDNASSTGTGGKGRKESGVEKIASGTRNVTLNIAKFQLAENIVSQKADMSDVHFQERLRRALLAAVNDVNIVAQ